MIGEVNDDEALADIVRALVRQGFTVKQWDDSGRTTVSFKGEAELAPHQIEAFERAVAQMAEARVRDAMESAQRY